MSLRKTVNTLQFFFGSHNMSHVSKQWMWSTGGSRLIQICFIWIQKTHGTCVPFFPMLNLSLNSIFALVGACSVDTSVATMGFKHPSLLCFASRVASGRVGCDIRLVWIRRCSLCRWVSLYSNVLNSKLLFFLTVLTMTHISRMFLPALSKICFILNNFPWCYYCELSGGTCTDAAGMWSQDYLCCFSHLLILPRVVRLYQHASPAPSQHLRQTVQHPDGKHARNGSHVPGSDTELRSMPSAFWVVVSNLNRPTTSGSRIPFTDTAPPGWGKHARNGSHLKAQTQGCIQCRQGFAYRFCIVL